jgi:hypothetical protein
MSNNRIIKEETKEEMTIPIMLFSKIINSWGNAPSILLLLAYIVYDYQEDVQRDKKIDDCQQTYVGYILKNNEDLTGNLKLAMKEAKDNTRVLKTYLQKVHKIEFENESDD